MYKKLLEIQKEIGAIKKDATNPFFKSKYFDINSLLEQVKPVLNKHGVVLLQGITNINGKLALSTKLIDGDETPLFQTSSSGAVKIDDSSIEFICPLPDTADAQKAGSAVTYFRRYALQSLLALEAEDDDANIASGKTTSSPRESVDGKERAKAKIIDHSNDDIGF